MPDGLPFSLFEVRDDSNSSGDGLSHLNRIKLGGAATTPEGDPGAEPLSDRSARLWPSWSMPRYRRFYPIFERINRRMVTCKKYNTMPGWSWPNDTGV